jgi:GTP cyclohydrolase I
MQKKITRQDAINAVTTILKWIGEDPEREGLKDTPCRVVDSYDEHFRGYGMNPADILKVSFSEIDNYEEIIILKDIRFESFCEHHMAPIIGNVHIAYLPDRKVVGISKLVRLVEVFAKRLQIQERMTQQIAKSLYNYLGAKGVAVVIDAEHHCMTTRGVLKHYARMQTRAFSGILNSTSVEVQDFLSNL